jgi:hydroxymethylpyrimidine/phosphomethylpyrimidine kinase
MGGGAIMKKKQKAWSPEARARHLAGVKRYQEVRKRQDIIELLYHLGALIKAEPSSIMKTILARKKEFMRIAAIKSRMDKLQLIRELVADTMQKIKKGIIVDPVKKAAQSKEAQAKYSKKELAIMTGEAL